MLRKHLGVHSFPQEFVRVVILKRRKMSQKMKAELRDPRGTRTLTAIWERFFLSRPRRLVRACFRRQGHILEVTSRKQDNCEKNVGGTVFSHEKVC